MPRRPKPRQPSVDGSQDPRVKLVDQRKTYKISVRRDELLVELSQTCSVSLNVVRDVPLQVLNLGRPAFEQCVEDDFLYCGQVVNLRKRTK